MEGENIERRLRFKLWLDRRKQAIAMVALYVLCVTLVAVTNNVGRWQNVGENDWDNALWTTCMQDMGWRKQPADLEAMVLQRMLTVAPENVSPEMYKALAVVLRSEILARQELQQIYGAQQGGNTSGESLMKEEDETLKWAMCEQAIEETKGIYLSYQGRVIVPLWTYMTNGYTRDGKENHMEQEPYLQKIQCSRDILEPQFTSLVRCSKEKFYRTFAEELKEEQQKDGFGWPEMVCERDSAGYVMKIYLGSGRVPVEGGMFAERLGLVSPDFTWKYLDDSILFQVTGYGHGFGMSLVSAGKMADEGRDFMTILRHFYPGTELKK